MRVGFGLWVVLGWVRVYPSGGWFPFGSPSHPKRGPLGEMPGMTTGVHKACCPVDLDANQRALSLGWLVGLVGFIGLAGCLAWVGLGWVGLGWVGLGWVGLGWVGLGWVGLGWVGLGWVGWSKVKGNPFPTEGKTRCHWATGLSPKIQQVRPSG